MPSPPQVLPCAPLTQAPGLLRPSVFLATPAGGQTDRALTTSKTTGAVMMQRPHATMMATPYSGKPASGWGGSRVASGTEHSS